MIEAGEVAKRQVGEANGKKSKRDDGSKKSSGLGVLVGKLGAAVSSGANAINSAAIPMARSVVGTAVSLADTTIQSTKDVVGVIGSAATTVAGGMVSAA